jgi:putative ABC transport system permease protein
MGVAPEIGRVFTADEERPRAPRVIVLSHGLWKRRFAGDSGIVGRTVLLNGTAITVVGVMPPAFDFPSPTVSVWSPLRLDTDSLWTRNNHYLELVGRLRTNAALAEAAAQTRALDARMTRDYPDTYFPGKPLTSNLLPIRDSLLGATRPYLLALLGAVAFVLLIACGNVANLLLARGEVRRKEFAIRTALGAAPDRIVRQVLTESAVLAFTGGALGLLVAWGGVHALLALAPDNIPRLDQVHLDARVLGFTVLASLITGVVFGLVPAVRATRTDSAVTIRDGTRSGGHSGGVRNARRALVISEVALAVVMLVGAGLFVRSLRELQRSKLGFDPTQLLTAQISMLPREYSDERAVLFSQRVTEGMRVLPGVLDAAITGSLPLSGDESRWSIMVDGRVLKTIAEAPAPKPVQVSPEYFRVMRIPIVRGRGFEPSDRVDGAMVAVVNEAMARELWPGRDPIGHTIKMWNPDAPWATVVGVAADVRSSGYGAASPSTMYFPYSQAGKSAYYTPREITLIVRAKGDASLLASGVRRVVGAIDRTLPISRISTMEEILGTSIGSRRFSTGLLAGFALLALVLSSIGIYGVIAYGVSQRTYEIGLRMALGAERGAVLRLVLSEALRMVAIGLALGIAGGLVVARLVRSLLVGVGVFDPATLGVVAVALLGAAVIAALVPARRAAAISPTEALRAG